MSLKSEGGSLGALGVKVDKVTVDTSGRLESSFSLAEAFAGTKLTLGLVDAQRTADADKHGVKLSAEHKAAWGTLFAEADLLKHNLFISLLSGAEGALFGASVDYGLSAGVKVRRGAAAAGRSAGGGRRRARCAAANATPTPTPTPPPPVPPPRRTTRR